MSFNEKSLWLLLLALLGGFGWYFARVLPGHGANVTSAQVVLFVVMLGLVGISQIVGQALLAIAHRRELGQRIQRDERDGLIALRGSRIGAHVLATGAFAALCAALLIPGNFAFTHTLLAFWVLAQAVEYAVQLFLYRRGG